MRVWITALLLAMLALSGCAETGTDEPVTDAPEEGDAPDSDEPLPAEEEPDTDQAHDEGVDESGANNTAPVAIMGLDVDNGTAPLLVNISLDATDAEGDNLTWTLQLNGTEISSGEALPAMANATLEAGNHTFVFTVSDGELAGVANVTIPVLAGGDGSLVHKSPIFETFHMIEGCELCIDSEVIPTMGQLGAEGCAGWHLGENEVDCAWLAIPEGYAGFPWSAFSYTDGTLPGLGTDGDVDVEFLTACESGAESLGIVQEASFGQPESGIVPEGAGCMVGFEFSWPNAGHTIEFSLGEDVHS